MTAATITLNPGTGGALVLSDTLTTVDGAAAPASAQAQINKIAFGAQNTATSVTDTTPLPTSHNATIFRFSTNNTSTAQLTAGATFTGVIETALDQPSISLLLTSDQPTTLTVRQFIDLAGTRAVPDVVFYVAASTGFSRSFTLNGNYVQVLAQNTGASTTTTFNLNTAYGDLAGADPSGVLPVTELPLVLNGQAAQTAVVNNILTPTSGAAALNVSGMRAASVQVASTGTGGTFIFEQSNDGTNWVALPVFNAALATGVPITAAITATASAIVYSFQIRCSLLRLRIATTITGGSIQAFSRISSEPWTTPVQLVASNVAANLAATVSGTVTANIGTGSLAAGTNAIGDVGIQYRANATGAATLTNINCPATPVAQQLKSGAGRLIGLNLFNTSASTRWVKIFNLASASVTPGTTAATTEIGIPAGQRLEMRAEGGAAFSTGITVMITGGAGLTNNTAVTLADVTGFGLHA